MTQAKTLYPILKNYFRDDPATAAHNLESLSVSEALEIFDHISAELAAKIFRQLSIDFAADLVSAAEPQKIGPILEKAGGEYCSSVLLALAASSRESFLDALSEELREQIQAILSFPNGSAGKAMKTDFTAVKSTFTVKEAIAKLKSQASKKRAPSNIYVLNPESKLIGVISTRDLILASSSTRLDELMRTEVLSVEAFEEAEKALRLIASRGFTSIPVLDAQKRLIGVVRATNLLAGAKEQATEDLQKIFGAGKDERAFSPIMFSLKKRLPWLHINLLTAFMGCSSSLTL